MSNDGKDEGADADAVRRRLDWAGSKTVGKVTEIAVLTPIRKGCPPGERQTYEERMRAAIANIGQRHREGLPTELNRIPSIHFGRIIILRPEQYLVGSDAPGIDYYKPGETRGGGGDGTDRGAAAAAGGADLPPQDRIPQPIDDFAPVRAGAEPQTTTARFHTWALTLVEFDGDLKVYMRDIAKFLASDFDNLFRNCEHYPGTQAFERFWAWIRRYQVSTDLFYASYSNLSVARLKQLEMFKARFDAFVARVRSPQGATVRALDELFDDFLRENAQYPIGFPSPGGTYPSPASPSEA